MAPSIFHTHTQTHTHTKQNKTTQTKQANQEGVWEICRRWTFQSEKPEQTF